MDTSAAYDVLDEEAVRLAEWFGGLAGDEWNRPSRCDGWSVKDVLAHLVASCDYDEACLDGRVEEVLQEWQRAGVTGLDDVNQAGVDRRRGVPALALLDEWRRRNAEVRKRLRDRGDSTVTTSVGDYPARLQALHLASECAAHADDVGVPAIGDEAERRSAWRAEVARFAVGEAAKPVTITRTERGNEISAEGAPDLVLSDEELVLAATGRFAGLPQVYASLLKVLA